MQTIKSKILIILPFLIWSLAAAFFFMQYIARIAPSVMVPNLMRTFEVSAFSIGNLMAFFYYGYTIMQLPVGLLFDRFGIKKLLVSATLLAGLSTLIFAITKIFQIALLSRLVLGIVAAFGFIGAIKAASLYFSGRHFGFFTGMTQGLGMIGAAVGEIFVVWLVHESGWQHSILWIAAAFFALSFLIFVITPKKSETIQSKKPHQSILFRKSLFIVLKNPQTWINAVYAGILYAPMIAFSETWAPTFLSHVYDISQKKAAFADSLIFIAWGIGSFLIGFLSDRMKRRKPLMIFSVFASFFFLTVILYAPALKTNVIFALLFLFGLVNTGVSLSYATASEVNPHEVCGTAVAFANMASISFGALLQPLIGWLLDLQWDGKLVGGIRYYSAGDFRTAMLPLLIYLAIGCMVVFFIRETHCRHTS